MARGPAPNASPKNRRDALELVYMAEQLGSDRRTVATRCHTKAGIGAKFLLEKVSKLPEGLTNDANSASLRRACNRAVGLDKVTAVGEKDHRCYTNHELCTAVLTLAAGFRKRRDVLYEYMLPPTTYKRYVRGYGEWLEKLDKSCKQHKLLKWGKGSLPKDLPGVVKLAMEYFGRIQPRGGPAFLDDDDNTGSGAIGTSDQFIAARERAYKWREAKRQKKEESAAETKAKKTAKLQQSIIIAARLEQRIGDDDKVIGSLKIDELKALIIARGGAPNGNKGKLQEQLRELEPMDAAALAAADTDDVVAAPAAPPAPVAAAPPPAPKSARRSSRASRSSRR